MPAKKIFTFLIFHASYDLDIEPDNIEVADTVTVVWEIV